MHSFIFIPSKWENCGCYVFIKSIAVVVIVEHVIALFNNICFIAVLNWITLGLLFVPVASLDPFIGGGGRTSYITYIFI